MGSVFRAMQLLSFFQCELIRLLYLCILSFFSVSTCNEILSVVRSAGKVWSCVRDSYEYLLSGLWQTVSKFTVHMPFSIDWSSESSNSILHRFISCRNTLLRVVKGPQVSSKDSTRQLQLVSEVLTGKHIPPVLKSLHGQRIDSKMLLFVFFIALDG